MKVLFSIGFILIIGIVQAQYPFEKNPSIECEEYKNWVSYDKLEKEHKLHHTITIPNFYADTNSLTLQVSQFDTLNYSIIRIFKNKQQIQKLIEPDAFYGLSLPYPVYLADYNNDGSIDIKFLIPNHGCGAYNTYSKVIYLLQKSDGVFVKISYTDHFFEDDKNRLERDFDGDGNFEIITQTFQNYKNHNYWLYNIYSFKNFELVNANQPFNYPIMIQLLYRENYDITTNLSRAKMLGFSRKLPDDYSNK